jgi:EAL domain-containing protein (putative c-di-GMP-specific phosphodiesterase class I)
MRRLAEKVLTSPSRTVDTAGSGAEALELLKAGSYEVILTDIAMPGMSGLEFLRAVRDHDPDVPVVLVTGSPALETAIESMEYGAFRYLLKPVSPQDMKAVVDRAIRLHAIARLRRRALEVVSGEALRPSDRASLEGPFQRAIQSLHMVYQPIVSSRERRVFGYEALVRSAEPMLVSPSDLLASAEQLTRVRDLGRAIRRRVAEDSVNAPPDSVLFVNLHVTELEDESLYSPNSPLTKIASRVVLEITERASLDEIKDVPGRIGRLRELGFRLAVDDLGAAYSGLSTLARVEPEIVKLDMFLARGLAKNSASQAVVRSMVHLCRDLGMAFVCEGVETEHDRNALVELGCDLFQGFFFARPERGFQLVSDDGH